MTCEEKVSKTIFAHNLVFELDCYLVLTKIFPKNSDTKYNFIFQLDSKHNIGLPMIDGVVFLFSGSVLTNRQSSTTLSQYKDSFFFKIASYGNKRLFTHIKKSLKRKSNK